MQPETDVIRGVVRIDNLPDGCCFTSWQDFLRQLPSLLSIELPTLGKLVVSAVQPGEDYKDYVWVRVDASGSFLGVYMFSAGVWQQVLPAPGQLVRLVGDSRSVPAGYLLADASNPHFTALTAAALEHQWIKDPTGLYYVVFDVTYEGF